MPLPCCLIEVSKRQAYLEQIFIFRVLTPPHLDEAFECICDQVVQLSSAAKLIKAWGDNQLVDIDIRLLILDCRNIQLKRYKTISNGGVCGEISYNNIARADSLRTRSHEPTSVHQSLGMHSDWLLF